MLAVLLPLGPARAQTACPPGQSVGPDTQGHCCFPAQAWSNARNQCVGIPACSAGMRAEGEACVVACKEGQVITAETDGRCCWPGQIWSRSRQACAGVPTCPEGTYREGTECISTAGFSQPAPTPVEQPAPQPAAQPAAQPAPQPVPDPGPQPVQQSAPAPIDDSAPVPMDAVPSHTPAHAAPVPIDAPTSTAPSAVAQQTAQEKEAEALSRSLWVLGVDFLIDMSSGRFGLRLRTDIPLYRGGHWVPFLGFGAGVLPPSFIAGTINTAWVIPLEATVGLRIPLIAPEPRVHLIPRAGINAHPMFAPNGVDFGFKVLLGLGARLNFGSAFGLNLGFDALIPVIRPGFVFLTSVGISV